MSETPTLTAPIGRFRASRGAMISALTTLSLLLLLTAAGARWLRLRLIREERAAVTLRLAPYVNALSIAVNRRVGRVSGLKAFVESASSAGEIQRAFPVLAAGLQEGATGVRAIQLVKGGIIWANHPATSKSNVVGYNLTKDPRSFIAADLIRALRTGAMTVTGPILMSNGQPAIYAEQRINSTHRDFPDLAVVMLEFNAVFEVASMARGIPGLDIALLDRGGHVVGPEHATRPADPVTLDVSIPDGDWQFLAAPHGGWGAAAGSVLNALWAAGILIAVLLAAFVYLTLERQYGLTAAVRERTVELEHTNQELRREVHERVVAETVLRKHEESQLHRQKMEAVGTLAGGIAHDFNNILTAILGFGRLAEEQLAERNGAPLADEELNRVRNDVLEMMKAAEHATILTNQLLSFSRRQMVKPEALDAAEAVRSVGALLRGILGERVELVIETTPDLPLVFIDKSQLTQVLLNLALNARDAMPDGGTLTIATAGLPAMAEDDDLPAGHYVEISVRDTGIGMSSELKVRAFEPFFTTKGLGKGTGLGLSTVYGIVSRAHGRVQLDTAEGSGTSVRVFLPAHAGEVAQHRQSPPRGVAVAGETILVAEDESSVGDLAARILRRAGYTVLLAPSGEAALALFEAHPYTVDLLITDCVMPGISGLALAQQLRTRDATLPVLFMSGYTDQLVELKQFRGGHCAELAKPFTAEALVLCAIELLHLRVR